MAAPLLFGAVLGAAATYLLDPDQGRRRRAMLREQLSSRAYQLSDSLGVGGRDLSNRARGMVFGLRSRLSAGDIPDDILVERVRSRLGRVSSHPGAIGVTATQGQVLLSGPILAREHDELINAVCAVPGVVEVNDQLEVHESAEGVPSLQGGRQLEPERAMFMQQNWTPAARTLAGTTGGLLLLNALQKRGLFSVLMALAGGALLLRSSTNIPLRQLAGMSARRAVDVHKTIHVSASVEQVFDALAHYENFPQFMTNVREVRVREDGSSHWVVAGPGGIPVEWDAVTTRMEPNRLLAWRTLPSSIVQHAGLIHFQPADGGTRVDIEMSYNPPAGALGHAVAQIFRSDAKTELDEDLMRLKVFLETGKPPRDAAAAVRH